MNRAPLVSIPVTWMTENEDGDKSETKSNQNSESYSGPDLPYIED